MNTRVAPSPTGFAHIGFARTAYFNWLAARSTGGKFILRIDDTDEKRNKPEYTEIILKVLNWLNLDYDNIVFQSSRFAHYRETASILLQNNYAAKKDGAIVLSIPKDFVYPLEWKDRVIGQIKITEDDHKITNGMVLIKSDGSPTYNFASVIDDIDLNINLIIRGVDHVTNTSKQSILFSILNAHLPEFSHVGLICVKNKPMSKRDNASSMMYYLENNYNSDAMLNFLARLGWSPTIDDKSTKVLPREKMLKMFLTEGKMRASNANFDPVKLESFNRKYKAKEQS